MNDFLTRFGSRRSAVSYAAYGLLGRVGMYRSYSRIDWPAVRRLVFVCSGNICRSPFAAELGRRRGMQVASFGVDAVGGAAANDVATRVAARWDVELDSHLSTSKDVFDLQRGDLLIAMEPKHVEAINPAKLPAGTQVTLLGLWSKPQAPYLPDPYGCSEQCFEHVFRLIDSGLRQIEELMPRTSHVPDPQSRSAAC